MNKTEMNVETGEERDLEFTGREANRNLSFRQYSKSRHAQYFTPVELSETILEMLMPAMKGEEFENISVLDPTCGSGRLLLPWHKAKARVMGIELDKDASLVAKRLLGKENIRTGDVLEYAGHLENFSLAVSNPPYGLRWNAKEKDFCFECLSYGDSIESQSATIEIITKALSINGMIAVIHPENSFTNEKDEKLRKHLFGNYSLLLRATLLNAFRQEYGIGIAVDLIIAQKDYQPENQDYEKIRVDVKDFGWRTKLVETMHRIIEEKKVEIEQCCSAHVPFLDSIRTVELSKMVKITPKGIRGNVSSIAMLDFINRFVQDYNPIQGIRTGVIDAYLSVPNIIRRGMLPGRLMLGNMGFETYIEMDDVKRVKKLKEKYDFLETPLYRPKPHQLLAYFYDMEYEARATVKDKENKILFREGKRYSLHPTWIRRKETVSIAEAFEERSKKRITIKTEVDRGYLAIRVMTEQGEMIFNEINAEEVKTFTDAFSVPEIKDVNDRFPEMVERNRKRIEKEMKFLFDYQKEDLSRLALKPFGYIGYEMGGGKTVSAACWASLRDYKNILVVCQSSLIENWMNELKKFGFRAERMNTHDSVDRTVREKRKNPGNEIVFYVTSYEFLSLDTGRKYDEWDCVEYDNDGNIRRQSLKNKTEKCPLCHRSFSSVIKSCPKCREQRLWTGNFCNKCGYSAFTYSKERKSYHAYRRIKKIFDAVIVDEAQMAKTKNSGRGRAVRALKSKGKLILTGTLMKGYITDVFWSLGWLLGHGNPLFHYDYFGGSKVFLNEFATYEYVTRQFEDNLSEGRARMLPEVSNLNRFWRILSSFTIRRLKDEMIVLPKKNKHIILLEMDEKHREVYAKFSDWATNTIKRTLSIASGNRRDVNMGIISSCLWKMRFAATVPNASTYLCDEKGPGICLKGESWNKTAKVIELVKEIKKRNEKVIIFSGLRPMVSAIARSLKEERIEFIPITAGNKTSERFELIKKFSENGVTAIVAGLNVLNRGFTITAANNVIITDIEYSPESVLQAEDRAHRTGQQKEVNVYYLFSKGTIDEIMFELVSKKQIAINNAIDGRAVYAEIAELVENVKGNIQLEIAKRVAESAQNMIEEIVKVPDETVITEDYKEPGNETWDKLYEMKINLLKSRRIERKKQPEKNERQAMLFGFES